MGICALPEFLGAAGYFTLKQSSLKAMLFVAGDKCGMGTMQSSYFIFQTSKLFKSLPGLERRTNLYTQN
jgi:hypothetical protein